MEKRVWKTSLGSDEHLSGRRKGSRRNRYPKLRKMTRHSKSWFGWLGTGAKMKIATSKVTM